MLLLISGLQRCITNQIIIERVESQIFFYVKRISGLFFRMSYMISRPRKFVKGKEKKCISCCIVAGDKCLTCEVYLASILPVYTFCLYFLFLISLFNIYSTIFFPAKT